MQLFCSRLDRLSRNLHVLPEQVLVEKRFHAGLDLRAADAVAPSFDLDVGRVDAGLLLSRVQAIRLVDGYRPVVGAVNDQKRRIVGSHERDR